LGRIQDAQVIAFPVLAQLDLVQGIRGDAESRVRQRLVDVPEEDTLSVLSKAVQLARAVEDAVFLLLIDAEVQAAFLSKHAEEQGLFTRIRYAVRRVRVGIQRHEVLPLEIIQGFSMCQYGTPGLGDGFGRSRPVCDGSTVHLPCDAVFQDGRKVQRVGAYGKEILRRRPLGAWDLKLLDLTVPVKANNGSVLDIEQGSVRSCGVSSKGQVGAA